MASARTRRKLPFPADSDIDLSGVMQPTQRLSRKHTGGVMPQFVIEREMPGAGRLSTEDLKMASQTSCSVLRDLGPQIQWVHSYVTDNKIYCVYRAPNEDMIREHAQRGGFPANKISQVRTTIDPTTAE